MATFSPGFRVKFMSLSTAFAELVSHDISVALIKMDCSSSLSLHFCLAYLLCNSGASRNFKIRVKETFASMNTNALVLQKKKDLAANQMNNFIRSFQFIFTLLSFQIGLVPSHMNEPVN
jgi:hypothetical protein